MRKLLLLIFLFASENLYSQLYFDFNAGYGVSLFQNYDEPSPLFAPVAGVGMRYQFNEKSSVGIEAFYNRQGAEISESRSLVIDYISIPIVLKTVYDNGFMHAAGIGMSGMGPYKERFTFDMDNENTYAGFAELNDFHVSYVADIGYSFGAVEVSARWLTNFSKLASNYEFKYHSFSLYLRYTIERKMN